jgi:membrane protein
MISQLIRFINTDIWKIRLKNLSRPKAFFIKYLRIIILATRSFVKDDCQKTASVLTYYSLLNVVPVIAVVFGIAKGFGLEKIIEKQILQAAEKANWQADLTNQILNFSHSFLEKVNGGLIAGIGVILLLWTVISIMGKIEDSFNGIWEVRKSRTLARKFTDYLAMMFLAPVLLVVSSSATVLVASKVQMIVNKIAFLGIFGPLIFFLLSLLPYVSMWTLLTMLYLVMPNTRISLSSGILGGVAAGTIYQIVQWVYIKFQIGVASYSAIYGSFAALPLFLVWVQMSWMILLLGAEIAHASEHYETFGFYPDYFKISTYSKKFLILRIIHLVTKKFTLRERPLSAKQIASALEIPVRLVQQLLDDLTNIGLVTETTTRSKNEVVFQPGRPIEDITVKHALEEYEKNALIQIPDFQSEEAESISKYLRDISDAIEKSPGNVTLKGI